MSSYIELKSFINILKTVSISQYIGSQLPSKLFQYKMLSQASLHWLWGIFQLTSLNFCFLIYKGAPVVPPSMCCIINRSLFYQSWNVTKIPMFSSLILPDCLATSVFQVSFRFTSNWFKHALLPSHLWGHSSSCLAH